MLAALNATGRVLVIAPGVDEKLRLSARNLPTVEVILADSLNVVDVLNADTRRDRAAGARPDGGGLPVSVLIAPEIILRPVVSEKSIDQSTLTDRNPTRGNKYTFRVHPDANKIQIKAAVEELYATEKVTVVAVNVLTTKAKQKSRGTRRGRIKGSTSPWRKADRHPGPGPEDPVLRGRLRCRCAPTSRPRRAAAG